MPRSLVLHATHIHASRSTSPGVGAGLQSKAKAFRESTQAKFYPWGGRWFVVAARAVPCCFMVRASPMHRQNYHCKSHLWLCADLHRYPPKGTKLSRNLHNFSHIAAMSAAPAVAEAGSCRKADSLRGLGVISTGSSGVSRTRRPQLKGKAAALHSSTPCCQGLSEIQ